MYWLILTLVVIEFDQLIKLWTVTNIAENSSMLVVGGLFKLTHVVNTGAAFSTMQGMQYIFIPITIIVILIMLVALIYNYLDSPMITVSFALIIGGGIGNLIDRLINGYVVDMFEFAFFQFAVFNFADAAVTIGGILFAYCVLFDKRTIDALSEKKLLKKAEKSSKIPAESVDNHDEKSDN